MNRADVPLGGQVLIQVIVGSALLAALALGLTLFLSGMFRSMGHAELKSDISSLKLTLSQMIDCNNTLAPVNLATDCSPTANPPKYFQLKNRNNAPLTGPLVTNPSSLTYGAGLLGANWYIRAHCDTTAQSLFVEAARLGNGPTGFFVDPMNKRELAWNPSPINPQFGGPTSKICVANFGGATTCPQGQYVVGINPGSLTPICQALPAGTAVGGCEKVIRTSPVAVLGMRNCWGQGQDAGASINCLGGSHPVVSGSAEDAIEPGERASNGADLYANCTEFAGPSATSMRFCQITNYTCIQ